jgi:MFS family permease
MIFPESTIAFRLKLPSYAVLAPLRTAAANMDAFGLCPDGRVALTGTSTSPCLAASRPFILAATILASAMGFIDGSVVTIALPSIERDLLAPFETIQWVVNGYTLTLGSVILIGGAAGDRYGRRRTFLIGIAIFTAASIACALAPGITMLIGARLVQGIGAALMIPQSLAIITASFPKTVRGQAIGVWAAASAITTALGPTLGGFLIDALSWRAAFWINVPIACAVIWLTLSHVPESRNETETGELDWLGGLLAVIVLVAFTQGLSSASASSSLSFSALISFSVAALAFVLFGMRESRVSQPLLPARALANPRIRRRQFAHASPLRCVQRGVVPVAFRPHCAARLKRVRSWTRLSADWPHHRTGVANGGAMGGHGRAAPSPYPRLGNRCVGRDPLSIEPG